MTDAHRDQKLEFVIDIENEMLIEENEMLIEGSFQEITGLRKEMRLRKELDPAAYRGAKFHTKTRIIDFGYDHRIRIYPSQRSAEQAEVKLIAGVTREDLSYMKRELKRTRPKTLSEKKRALENIILERGKEPLPGLRMIMLFTDAEAKERGINGLYTEELERVILPGY